MPLAPPPPRPPRAPTPCPPSPTAAPRLPGRMRAPSPPSRPLCHTDKAVCGHRVQACLVREPRREAPRQLRQRHEGPPDGGPTMPQSPHTLPSHTHTHFTFNPSTTIHPARPHGRSEAASSMPPSPLPCPLAPGPARSLQDSVWFCDKCYGFVTWPLISAARRGRAWSAQSESRAGGGRARAAGRGDGRGQPARRGIWRHPLPRLRIRCAKPSLISRL